MRDDQQSQVGVYFLFRRRKLVYVGQSKNPDQRVAAHRRNGRSFDFALTVPCDPRDVGWIERELIASLNPPQNRLGVTSPRADQEDVQIIQIVQPPRPAYQLPLPDPRATVGLGEAQHLVDKFGLRVAFKAAVRDGSLRSVPKNLAFDQPGARRLISHGDLDVWIEAKLAERAATGFRQPA